jgi:hypothetical protein
MTQRLADIQQQLIGTFFEEAREALTQIENGLLALDTAQGDRPEVILAAQAGADAIGVILTGMAADGAEGLLAMKKAGAVTVAQDRWGMPGEAVKRGAATETLPLQKIAARIAAWARRCSSAGDPTARCTRLASTLRSHYTRSAEGRCFRSSNSVTSTPTELVHSMR